jgi:hypothetical protein
LLRFDEIGEARKKFRLMKDAPKNRGTKSKTYLNKNQTRAFYNGFEKFSTIKKTLAFYFNKFIR